MRRGERLIARGAGFPARSPRPAGGRRSLQARPSPRPRAGTRWSRDARRQACEPEQGTAGALAPARPASARRTQFGREAGAPRSHANARVDANSAVSRPRIPGGGWKRWTVPKGSREAAAARPEGAQARPTCRGGSPVAAVLAELLDELLQAHDGLAPGGGPASAIRGGVSQPSRTPRAINSSSGRFRLPRGGPISATTRSRSVTSTVSPAAAKRTYSLSLFFKTFRPTDRMERT